MESASIVKFLLDNPYRLTDHREPAGLLLRDFNTYLPRELPWVSIVGLLLAGHWR